VVEVKFIRLLTALLVLALAWLPGISPAKFSAIAASSTSITASNSASPAQGIFDSFRGWFSDEGANQELLPPGEAFEIAVRSSNADTLVATLAAADGYYLYRDGIAFDLQESPPQRSRTLCYLKARSRMIPPSVRSRCTTGPSRSRLP